MRRGCYCSSFVCLSVCLSVCPHSSAGLVRVCNELNLPARSLLHFEGFQLTDFAKKLSFSSYSLFCFWHRQTVDHFAPLLPSRMWVRSA